MTKLKKELLLILVAMLITTISAISPVYAASKAQSNVQSKVQTVRAYQGVKIIYNANELTDTNQPYTIGNTVYVPLRVLMNNFGKSINWDSVNKKVVITDVTSTTQASINAQIITLQNKNTELQNTIKTLNSKISTLEDELDDEDEDDTSTSDIKEALNDYFEDAGDDYFGDDGIDATISLSGDEDDLAYTIKLDFDDADDYDNLSDISQTKLKSFLNAVKSKINSEIDGTDYEDADITGKLVDNDDSDCYVKYNGSSYTFSWDDEDNTSTSDIAEALNDYFEDAGDDYFGDDGIDVSINLSGDEDDLAYTIYLDLDDADDYDNLSDISQTKLKSFLNAVKSKINSEIDGTDYEDADISGKLIDDNNSSYYVKYDDSSYTFSWD